MQTIVAGRLETQERAEQLMATLREHGVALSDMQAFFLPPPGQRAQFPIGGDEYADSDAEAAPRGQARGAALGAAAGLVAGGLAAAAIPPLAPALLAGVTGVGALAGSVAGAVSGTKPAEESVEEEQARAGGLMVAVRVSPDTDAAVLEAFRAAGAEDVERATGEWRDGRWVDFDPLESPHKVDDGTAGR